MNIRYITNKFINWKNKYLLESQPTIDSLRQTLKEARHDIDGTPYPHTAGEYKKMFENLVKEKMEVVEQNSKITHELLVLRSDYRTLLRKYDALLSSQNNNENINNNETIL